MKKVEVSGLLLDGWLFEDCYIVGYSSEGYDKIMIEQGIQSALYCSRCGKFLGRSMRPIGEKYSCKNCLKEEEK